MSSIFPLVEHSVLFLVDGSINGQNEIVGTLYPFEEFPWNTKPGLVVWSKAAALQQFYAFQQTLYDQPKVSPHVQKQVEDYFHKPPNQWWINTSPVLNPKAPFIKGKLIRDIVVSAPPPRPASNWTPDEKTGLTAEPLNYVQFSDMSNEKPATPVQQRVIEIPRTLSKRGPVPKPPTPESHISLGPPPPPPSRRVPPPPPPDDGLSAEIWETWRQPDYIMQEGYPVVKLDKV